MRVMFDGVVYQNGYQRGIQRVFRELIRELREQPGAHPSRAPTPAIEIELFLTEPARAGLPSNLPVRHMGAIPGLSGLLGGAPRGMRQWIVRRLGRRSLGRALSQCDLYHSTYFNVPAENVRAGVVVHVYDMIMERHSDLFSGRKIDQEIQQKAAAFQRADAIIAISEFTRREVEHFYPATVGKVRAIHLGAEHLQRLLPRPADHPPTSDRRPAPNAGPTTDNNASAPHSPYALFVGDRGLYKNFAGIMDAMECPSWPSDVALVVVGSKWKANELLRVETLHRLGRNIRLAGRVSEHELWALYRAAACVLVPSISEGFGFPVLEGQSAGVPVVCSDIAVFRELLTHSQGASPPSALFFSLTDPDSLARSVARALESSVRTQLQEAGRANLQRFSWANCASQTLDVYQSVMARAGANGTL